MRRTTYDDKGNKVGEIKNWSQVKIGAPSQTIIVYQGNILIYSNGIPM